MQQFSFQPEAAAVFALTSIALFLKGLVLSYLQVRWRVRGRAFERPEDAQLMGLSPREEPEAVKLVAAAWRNELENTPAFLSLAAAYVLLGGTAWSLLTVSVAYVGFRCFQAFAQVKTLQPHRTVGFLGGLLACLSLAALVSVRAWSVVA